MELNFPEKYGLRIQNTEASGLQIWDPIRKKWVALNPEEWVRQHVIHYLVTQRFPASRIAIERQLEVNGLRKRFDLLVFDELGMPELLVECKAPDVVITERTMLQIATYNSHYKAKTLLVTNGMMHYYYAWDGNQFELIKMGLPN